MLDESVVVVSASASFLGSVRPVGKMNVHSYTYITTPVTGKALLFGERRWFGRAKR